MPLIAKKLLHLFTAVSALVFVLQIWQTFGWLRGTMVEPRSLIGEL